MIPIRLTEPGPYDNEDYLERQAAKEAAEDYAFEMEEYKHRYEED